MGMSRADAGKMGYAASSETLKLKFQQLRLIYAECPSFCHQCGVSLPYKKRENKFCDRSCSATYSNTNRNAPTTNTITCLYCVTTLNKRSQKKYCNNACQMSHAYDLAITKWKSDGNAKGTYRIPVYIRRYLFIKYDNKCISCGWGECNPHSGNIPLEVDHIDGNHENNNEDNLRLLCPNCHSLTPTYKNMNNGNGRHLRRKRYAQQLSY